MIKLRLNISQLNHQLNNNDLTETRRYLDSIDVADAIISRGGKQYRVESLGLFSVENSGDVEFTVQCVNVNDNKHKPTFVIGWFNNIGCVDYCDGEIDNDEVKTNTNGIKVEFV